jgi:hypothetical protein
MRGKQAYLKRITAGMSMPSTEVGKDLEGSTPPSVFIGSWNYPKVYAGPMIAPLHGDTAIMDTPESWIGGRKTQEEIIGYRLNLVRGKRQTRVNDLENRFVEKLQDISLSGSSLESQAQFESVPKGASFSDDHSPFGPSAVLESFEAGSARWNPALEKVYYDDDLKAADAVMELHGRGIPFSAIQKAFSVGSLGLAKRRRLVPTRWSITACDSTIASRLLERVRHCEVIEGFRVHEFGSLNNHYAVLLLPTAWRYEWMEAFLHILGREEMIFSDYEGNGGKKGYSAVGGCYYACKMAVLEALERQEMQAGAIILREAYSGYVPLGVFNVRENVRSAMAGPFKEFEGLKDAISYISSRLVLPARRFVEESSLLREALRSRQTTLSSFSS